MATLTELGTQIAKDIKKRARATAYDVRDYGAKGDGTTDDTAAIIATIAAAPAGATVVFPTGEYKVTSEIVVEKSVSLRGLGATINATTMPAGAAYGQVAVFRFRGALGSALPVSAEVAKWSKTVTGISSTAGIAKDDLVLLRNDERPVPGMTRTDRDKGELAVVDAVGSSTSVTFGAGALFQYGTTSLQVVPVSALRGFTISGLTLQLGGSGSWHNGIIIQYARDVTVSDVRVYNANDSAIDLKAVWNGTVERCLVVEATSPSETTGGTGYGVAVTEGSRHCRVANNRFYGCRHFVAGGGQWPAAFIDVVGNQGQKSYAAAYDCHESCFYWKFVGNTANGVDSGFIIRGQYITVEDNVVEDSASFAYRVQTFDAVSEQRGIRIFGNSSTRSGSGLSIEGRVATSGSESVKIDLEVVGNTIQDVYATSGTGIFISNFQGATVKNNTVRSTVGVGIYLLGLSASPSTDLDLAQNKVSDTGAQGIRMQYVNGGNVDGTNAARNALAAIEVDTCNDISIVGHESTAGAQYGLYIRTCSRVHVSNAHIRGGTGATYDAIRVTGSTDVSVFGGIVSSLRHGIYTTTTDYVSVVGVNARGAIHSTKINVDATNKAILSNFGDASSSAATQTYVLARDVSLTQAQYDALATKDSTVTYLIT